ncbi:MAG: tetratricopeptide repeat protein [Beijerinckiaceae bacterium]
MQENSRFDRSGTLTDSKSWSIVIAVLVIAAILLLKFLDSNFSADGLMEKAKQIAVSDGCGAALATYDHAIRRGAGWVGYVERGNCQLRLGDLDAALSDYSNAIRLNPDASVPRYNRGLVERAGGKTEQALADWVESARLNPKDPAPHLRMAETMRGQGRLDDALREYDAALAVGGNGDEIHMRRAQLLRIKADYAAAQAEYEQVMKSDSSEFQPAAFFQHAMLFGVQGEAARALEMVNDGLERWKENAYGLYQRGLIKLFYLSSPEEAARDFSQSLDLGEKYRKFAIIFETGVGAATGEPAKKPSLFAPAIDFIPTAYEVVLYLHLARIRAGHDDTEELAKNFDSIAFELRDVGSLSPSKHVWWPGPIIQYFMNKIGIDDLMTRAKASQFEASSRICAVNFFLGFSSRQSGKMDQSREYFSAARDQCPADAAEKAFAQIELDRFPLTK